MYGHVLAIIFSLIKILLAVAICHQGFIFSVKFNCSDLTSSGVSRIVETPGHLYTKLVGWQYTHRLYAILVMIVTVAKIMFMPGY